MDSENKVLYASWVPPDPFTGTATVCAVPFSVAPWSPWRREDTQHVDTTRLPLPASPLWAFEQRLLLVQCLFTSNWTCGVGATLLLSGNPPILSFCQAVTQQGTSYLLNSECKQFPA